MLLSVDQLPYVTFWTPEMLDGLWHYLKWLLFLGMPLVFIVLALYVADFFVNTVLDAVFTSKKDDDEDDIYYY